MSQSLQFMPEKEAKLFAAGHGGELMTKYPLQYCKPAFLGLRPTSENVSKVFNGTATLLELDSGIYAVTCAHVVDAYYQEREQSEDAFFQIGMTEIDIKKQLACINRAVDLATIRLAPEQIEALKKQGEIGGRVVKPAKWPPDRVNSGEPLMFGGFPGAWREQVNFDELVFGSFSAIGIKVANSDSNRFSCQLERDYWVSSFARGDSDRAIDLETLGGLSGGPAFVDRGLHFELAGFIFEHSEAYDILFLRPAGLIREDGSIAETL